eukprot:SAG22_NODE_13139_length_417_cov_0.874214_1_plen_36_part_10
MKSGDEVLFSSTIAGVDADRAVPLVMASGDVSVHSS